MFSENNSEELDLGYEKTEANSVSLTPVFELHKNS